ncbi:MAG: hypothetical protein HYY17_13080 [Planctomycetes bacterium]|nr:hypothetical protein [Planctomycetota bacterium]
MHAIAGIASALLALLIAHGLGRIVLRKRPADPVRLVARTAAGLGLWGLCLLALGIAGLYTRAGLGALTVLLALPALGGGRQLIEDLGAWRGVFRDRLAALIFAATALVLLFNAVRAAVPTSDNDSLRYHLAAPKTWLREGRIVYLPVITINGPASAQCFNGLFLAFPGERGATLFVFLTLVLSVALAAASLLSRYGPRAAAVAAAAIAGLLNFKDLIGSASDIPAFTLFTLASLVFLADRAWLPAALFAGFAAGAKMAGLAVILIATLLTIPLGWRKTLGLALVAGALAFPWYLKSWAWTGNPVWPFAYSVFGGRDWSAAAGDELVWGLGLGRSPVDPAWFAGLAYRALLWRTGAPFLLVPLLLVLFRLDRRQKILLGAFCLAVPLWWLSSPQPRFLLPFHAAVAMTVAVAAARLMDRVRPLAVAAVVVLAVGLAYQGTGRAWNVWRGKSRRVCPRVVEHLNRELPGGAVVFVNAFGVEFLLERRFVTGIPLISCAVLWPDMRSAEELRARLRELGITHVLTTPGPTPYFRTPPGRTLDPMLDRCGVLLRRDGGLALYALRD